MLFNSVSNAAMEKSYSALWQRMQAITNNIANEDTPGYKAKRVTFEDALANELNMINRTTTQSKEQAVGAIARVTPQVYTDENLSIRADGNNVDINSEQIELARVQMQYELLQQRITGHYSTLKLVINGGR